MIEFLFTSYIILTESLHFIIFIPHDTEIKSIWLTIKSINDVNQDGTWWIKTR